MKMFILGMGAVFCCAALHMGAEAQVGYVTETIEDGVSTQQPVRTDDFARSIQAILKRARLGETLNYADSAELTKIATELKLPAVKNTCYAIAQSAAYKAPATTAPIAPAAIAPSTYSQSTTYLPNRDYTYYSDQTSGNSSQTTGGYTPPSTYVPVTNYSNVPVNSVPVNQGRGSEPLPAALITYYPANLCTELGLVNCPDSSEY